MKIGVLFTGQLRTIKKTIRYHLQNVIRNNNNVHIFACIENDTKESNSHWEEWLRKSFGANLITVHWFQKDQSPEWQLFSKNLSFTTISSKWQKYLLEYGSIIEYIQLFYAYRLLSLHEQTHKFVYDYIIRLRTDTIFAKTIDFHWLEWSDTQVEVRWQLVNTKVSELNLNFTFEMILFYFMITLFDDALLDNIKALITHPFPARDFAQLSKPTADQPVGSWLNEYIKTGSYILTCRQNNVYIVRRDLFYLIPATASLYALLNCPKSGDYWFNSETQFKSACYHSGLSIYDHNTLFEDKCLYEYDESRYFDENFNIKNKFMVYCVVRR